MARKALAAGRVGAFVINAGSGSEELMRVAVASGKGGTGKTTVAVNLAKVVPRQVRLLDCDVEEPNCALFLSPKIEASEPVCVLVPKVDASICSACGECGRFCEFNAIVALGATPLVFPELCHGCGGCAKVCPENAIVEVGHPIGVVETGRSGDIGFAQGRLEIGEAMVPPLIAAVKRQIDEDSITIIDSPPGTSCPVIEAVRGSDLVILVTEPTPFGLEDLKLAVDTMRELQLRLAVVVNRVGVGDDRVAHYCRAERIPILAELPNDRRVAEAYSRGETAVDAIAEWRSLFEQLLISIEGSCGGTTAVASGAEAVSESLGFSGRPI